MRIGAYLRKIPVKLFPSRAGSQLTYFLLFSVLGFVSVAGLALLTSGRTHYLPQERVVFLVLFIQWQSLTLTVAKLGIDQYVFTTFSSESRGVAWPSAQFVLSVSIVASGVSLLSWAKLGTYAVLVLAVSAVLDMFSVLTIAQLNAQKRYRITFIANVLNYPLFFFLILVFSRNLDELWIATLFLCTSVARLLYLSSQTYREITSASGGAALPMWMVLQQCLNYLLFKADQACMSSGFVTLNPSATAETLYLQRFPEIVSGISVVFGAVWLHDHHLRAPYKTWRAAFAAITGRWVWPAWCLAIVFAAVGYSLFFAGALKPGLVIAAALTALLVLPANAITFSLLRYGQQGLCLSNMIASLFLGLAFTFLIKERQQSTYIILLPTIQLACYCFLSYFRRWRHPALGE